MYIYVDVRLGGFFVEIYLGGEREEWVGYSESDRGVVLMVEMF